MKKGKKKTLKATVSPSNAANKAVTWKSSNKKVATVTSKGVVKAKKKGKATITVTTKDGKKKATCKITVK
ncbi:MAG: Ig-like domain-containing protein [Firmicutes bacterium]|nr:Ig-like domain-containing protein [Bacillota bacterium]